MKSAPHPENEALRLEALRASGLLDTPAEEVFDDFTKIAAALCDTPVALISLVDEQRQWFKSRFGLDAEETPREQAFCAHAILDPDPLVVPDAHRDERFADNPLVTGAPGVRFYAGVPLRTSDDLSLGTLCVIDREPREIPQEKLELLTSLARQVVVQIELRRLAVEVDRANEELHRLQRSQEEFIAAISHDIRSPLSTAAGFAGLLAEDQEITEKTRLDFLRNIVGATEESLRLSANLIDVNRVTSGGLQPERVDTDLEALLKDLEGRLEATAHLQEVALEVRVRGALPIVQVDPSMIERAVANFAGNAIRHAPRSSTVRIEARREGDAVRISVADSGRGVPPEETSALFTRYAKLSGVSGSAGLGLYIVRQLVEAHGGSVGYESGPEGGAVFFLTLPV